MAFTRFIFAGAVNTAVTYCIYLLLLLFLPYIWAYSITFVFGIGLGYIINAYWVFKKNLSVTSATTYPLVYGVNYLLGLLLLWVFVELLHIPKQIAPLLIPLLLSPVMFVLTKSVFQGKNKDAKINHK